MNRERDTPVPTALGSDTPLISAPEMLQLIRRTLAEITSQLQCTRLIAFSHTPNDGTLRAVQTVGFDLPDPGSLRISLADFPAADQALRTGQIRSVLRSSAGLPAAIRSHMPGQVIVVPLLTGDRRLAVLVGQLAGEVSIGNTEWQERAAAVADRAAVVAELARLSAAYQDERRLRLATQATIAAILEGRPLPELARIVTDQIADQLKEERVGLYLIDRQGVYHAAALRNISEEYAEGISRLRKQGAFSARALATHLPYFAEDAQNDPQIPGPLRDLFKRENIRSLLIAVLHHGDNINGALVVYPRGERRFLPRELGLFQALADQATLAVSITQQLEQQRDDATVEERNRLAREIHDTVAQSLAGVLMQVEMAETYLSTADYTATAEMLTSARLQSRKALEDTRRAVQGLAPPTLDQLSLSETLAEEAREFAAELGIEAPFVVNGEETQLSADQRLALLRIAQEALNNARKYARAHRVRIGLQYGGDGVVLIIDDDGAGFDTTARSGTGSTGGYGLFGMEERARLLGGELQIDSTPGWGTRIRASLPYRTARDQPLDQRQLPLSTPAPAPQIAAVERPHGAPAIRVIVADDHAIVRQGLKDILEATGDATVVGEAENGAEASTLAAQLRPDVVLMDLQMPEVDGIEGLRRIHAANPEIPVIVLTTFENEISVEQVLAAGARGYLLKDTEPAQLIAAIHAVQRGEPQFSSAITERLAALATGRGHRPGSDAGLNEREREVLDLLVDGARNREIATQLFITVSTVEKHIASLYQKLEVSNRTEAVRAAVDRGLVAGSSIPAAPPRQPRSPR